MPPSSELVEAVKTFFSCSVTIAIVVGLGWMLLRLQRAASRVPLPERRFEPTLVWLLVVPLFHLYWAFRVAKGISLGVMRARIEAGLPERPSGRGIGSAGAWSLLASAIVLLLSMAAGGLTAITAASRHGRGPDVAAIAFLQGLAGLFGAITLLLWIMTAACFVAFVHQIEAATSELD